MDNKKKSYLSGPSSQPLLGCTVGELFDSSVSRFPDLEALVSRHQSIRYTYRELGRAVDELARALMAIGIEKGDRVGIWSQNNAEWVLVQFATGKIGAILVNINPAYRIPELEYALKQSGTKALILAPAYRTSNYVEMMRQLLPEIKNDPKGGVRSGRLPDLRLLITIGQEEHAGFLSWPRLLELATEVTKEQSEERQAELEFDDAINIQYTSGTTGLPKGATLSHHNIINNGYFIGEAMRFTSQDRLCIPVPFYHCFGMVLGNLACITHGSAMILPSDRFDAEAVLETLEEEKCTAVHGVPTMFSAIMESPGLKKRKTPKLRTGIMAGSPCPIELMKQVISVLGASEITIAYGMTETSPVSFQTTVDDPIELRVSTVGRIHPHVEAKVINPLGRTLPIGQPGELCTRGYNVMLGYWNDPGGTAVAIDAAGWMHTGDLGVMDENGYVNIVGRIKDMVSRGGEKVFPCEVEEVLYTHPAISEVQVIGVPDKKYGEQVMAWIKLKNGCSASDADIREFCKDRMAYFKIPKYIKFVTEFPMTITGKIQKYKMREVSIEELGLQDAASIRTA
ncbi:MAG: AMP-binding protein [Armatimonadota bacterium]|nr:AMP-binding protein [Armatimonadota bacterium]